MSKGNKSKIDKLGRVVIPKSIREALNISHEDEISLYVEEGKLIITKRDQLCTFCKNPKVVQQIKDNFICGGCLSSIKDL